MRVLLLTFGHQVSLFKLLKGVLLYALLTGNLPFKGNDLEELKNSIKNDELVLPEFLSEEVSELIRLML